MSKRFRVWFTYCRLSGEKCSASFDAIDNSKPRMVCNNCKLALDRN